MNIYTYLYLYLCVQTFKVSGRKQSDRQSSGTSTRLTRGSARQLLPIVTNQSNTCH